MGSFYTNVTVLGSTADAVREVVQGDAYVADAGDAVVVFAADDEGDVESPTAQQLSARLGCVAMAVSVHDDDLLVVFVYDRGEVAVSGVVPDPEEMFCGDAADMGMPATLDPEAVVASLGRGDAEQVRAALTSEYTFATDRHAALMSALELPEFPVGWGFGHLAHDTTGYVGPPLSRITRTGRA